MMEERTLIVGLYLSNDNTQLSVLNRTLYEPEDVYQTEAKTAQIPTVLTLAKDTSHWYYGEEARNYIVNKEGRLIKNFMFSKVNSFMVYDTEITREALVKKFIRSVLLLLKREFPNDSIKMLVVTIKQTSPENILLLYQVLEELGLYKDRVRIVGHQLSFIYYALSQKKELWMNDVSLFDFDENGLQYYQITMDRRQRPCLARLLKKDFTETLSYDMIKENEENTGYVFEQIVNTRLFKQIISTIYLTGVGFEEPWIKPYLSKLCTGRRVFIGQNLFCYGACYAAKELSGEQKLEDIVPISDDTIDCTITTPVYVDGEIKEIVLAKLGSPWYEVNCSFDLIPDRETGMVLTVRNAFTKELSHHSIPLIDDEQRRNKTIRYRFELCCISRNTVSVTVKDIGFGQMYPGTDQIFEQRITI